MIACPDCGAPIQASKEHECDPAKAIRGLSILRDHLEEELGKMRERCEMLEAERDKLQTDVDYLRVDLRAWKADGHLWHMCFLDLDSEELEAERDKLQAERDEARQWARKLYRKLEDQYEIARQEYKENSQLRGRLNKMKATWMEGLDLWKRMRATIEQQRDRAGVENETLRAQLAEARNKALDEAIDVAGRLYPHPSAARLAIIQNIRALKNTGAYPADEISTGAKLRATLAEAQKSKDDMALDLHTAENQLVDVRYKALGDASLAANRALFIRGTPFETIRAVCGAILSQRDGL